MFRYITNNLQWCGCVDDGKTKGCVKGINYDNCERKDECSSSEPFWVAASRNVREDPDTIHLRMHYKSHYFEPSLSLFVFSVCNKSRRNSSRDVKWNNSR